MSVEGKFKVFGGCYHVKYTMTHLVARAREKFRGWALQIDKELKLFCKLCY